MSILDGLEREWDHAAGWFQAHHQPHPYDEHQHPCQEEHVTDIAAASGNLTTHKTELRAKLEQLITAGHEALDQHLPQIEQDAADVAAFTATASTTPVVQAALGAAHVPPELLAPIADVLNAYAASHPKPAEQPA